MTFRSGAEVKATSYSWGINIDLKAPAVDKENMKGQCGNNNGNPNDDFDGKGQHGFTQSMR